jgi:peptidoglycan biosynthesis protein MviN/MurJ (putative lipid II flippase)
MSAPAVTEKLAREARAGVAMSVATFAMAAASAIQAVLYLSEFGISGRTDGFFVAFALYTTIGVFSQSLRLTAVPLLVGDRPRLTPGEFALVLGLVAVPVIVATGPFASAVSGVLAPGLSEASRDITTSALPVLGAATVLQLWAAGAATVLAVRTRFYPVAASYMAGAGAGLITYVVAEPTAGELTLGWSMLAMAVVTCAGMLAGVRVSGGLGPKPETRMRLGRLFAETGQVLGRTLVYLVFNLLFVVTLSYASRALPGDSTVLSYGYLYASYLVAGTGMALGMSRIPDMTRLAADERRTVVDDTVAPGFRYALLLVAPAMGLLISGGAPMIHAVFPSSLDAAGVESLRTFAALLAPWTVAALLVSSLLPALFALGRARLVNLLAVPLLILHIAATAVGSELWGVNGAVGAFFVAPLAFAAVLVAVVGEGEGGRLAAKLGGDAVRFLGLAAVAYGAGEALSETVASGFAGALVASAAGTAIYAAGVAVLAQRQVRVIFGALRPAST